MSYYYQTYFFIIIDLSFSSFLFLNPDEDVLFYRFFFNIFQTFKTFYKAVVQN